MKAERIAKERIKGSKGSTCPNYSQIINLNNLHDNFS